MKLRLAVGFILISLSPAFAAKFDVAPSYIAAQVGEKTPYGQSTLRYLGLKVYDVALWTKQEPWSYATTFALHIQYDMNFSKKELANSSIDEMNHIEPLDKAVAEAYRTQLFNAFADVKPGDTITALYVPKKQVALFHNGTPIGRLQDMTLAQRFMDIWLSPKSSYPDIAKVLTRGDNTQKQAQAD